MSNSTYFVDGYPYSDTHNLNLDWIINKLKQIEIQMGEITDGLEVHVKDDSGTEVYVFTVKGNGIYVTRPDGGTPIYYNLASGQLHAPSFDGQSILTATGRATGQFRAGSLVLDSPLPITGGGTGATTATGARTALGAMASDAVIPITQGGTGATTASGARTNLGAMAADAVIPITQGGTGMTGSASGALTAGSNIVLSEDSLWKIGNAITCAFCATPSAQIAERATIATLPTGFRWSHDYPGFSLIIVNGATGQSIAGYTRVDGSIVTRGQLAANTAYWISFTMII